VPMPSCTLYNINMNHKEVGSQDVNYPLISLSYNLVTIFSDKTQFLHDMFRFLGHIRRMFTLLTKNSHTDKHVLFRVSPFKSYVRSYSLSQQSCNSLGLVCDRCPIVSINPACFCVPLNLTSSIYGSTVLRWTLAAFPVS
jgi:hypothetical protein